MNIIIKLNSVNSYKNYFFANVINLSYFTSTESLAFSPSLWEFISFLHYYCNVVILGDFKSDL